MTARPTSRAFYLRRESVVRTSATLILAVLILVCLGMVMLTSTSAPQGERMAHNPYYFFQRQAVWLAMGLIAAWIGAKVDYRWWIQWAWPILIGVAVLLVLVYVPNVGLNIKGSRRWLRLPFGLTFQPSELAKFAVINFLAFWYGVKRRERSGFVNGVVIPGAIFGSILLLIVFEVDFGATILIGATGGLMMFVAGAPLVVLAPLGVVAAGGLAWMIMQNPERMGRIMAFMNPERYAQDEAFQLMQALNAFAAGGGKGVGLGNSLQKRYYLPEAHTDFIFAIIGEELGIGASLTIVLLFVIILICGLRISGRARDVSGRLVAFGITVLISLQATINIGVVTGCLPTKGLPLPFISFGGTSLMMALFMVGVLLNIASQGGKLRRSR